MIDIKVLYPKLITIFLILNLIIPNFVAATSVEAIDEKEFEKNIQKRQEYGLSTDPEEVRKIMLQPKYQAEQYNYFGFVMSNDDLEEFSSRQRAMDAAKDLIPTIRYLLSGHYAGVYMDHEAGGIFKIGVVDLAQMDEETLQIKEKFHFLNRLQFFDADHTEGELRAKQREIDKYFDKLPILSTSTSVKENRVQVGVKEVNDEISQKLYDLFGEEYIIVVQGGYIVEDAGESSSETKEFNTTNEENIMLYIVIACIILIAVMASVSIIFLD